MRTPYELALQLQLVDGGYAILTGPPEPAPLLAELERDWRAARRRAEDVLSHRHGGQAAMRRLLTGAASLSEPGGVVALPGRPRFAVVHLHAVAGGVTAATAGPAAVVLTLGAGLGHALLQPDVDAARATARAVQQVAGRRLPWVLIQQRP